MVATLVLSRVLPNLDVYVALANLVIELSPEIEASSEESSKLSISVRLLVFWP